MGCSIGVSGVTCSGTMGGYIFDKNTFERFALTCGHVCGMQYEEALETLPFVVDMSEDPKITINQNSDEDHSIALEVAKLKLGWSLSGDSMTRRHG